MSDQPSDNAKSYKQHQLLAQNQPRKPQGVHEQLHRFQYQMFPGRPWDVMREWIRWQVIICKKVD